jgi:hypothetical protein
MLKSLLLFFHKSFTTKTQLILENIFLTVPTINFKLIHVLVIIEHHRRKLIHFNVTKNPTAEWSTQYLLPASSLGINAFYVISRIR